MIAKYLDNVQSDCYTYDGVVYKNAKTKEDVLHFFGGGCFSAARTLLDLSRLRLASLNYHESGPELHIKMTRQVGIVGWLCPRAL